MDSSLYQAKVAKHSKMHIGENGLSLHLFYSCIKIHINARKIPTATATTISKSTHLPITRQKEMARMPTETVISIKKAIINIVEY